MLSDMKGLVPFLNNKTNPHHGILGPEFPAVHPLTVDISFSDQISVELNSILELNTDPPPPPGILKPPGRGQYLLWGKHLITQASLTFLTCCKLRNCSAHKTVI